LLSGYKVIYSYQLSKMVFIFILGLSVPLIGLYIYLLHAHVLTEAINQIIVNNIYSYKPFITTDTNKSILQLALPTIPLWILFIQKWASRNKKHFFDYLLLFSIVVYLPFLFYRPYHHYWIPVLPFLILDGSGSIMSLILKKTNERK